MACRAIDCSAVDCPRIGVKARLDFEHQGAPKRKEIEEKTMPGGTPKTLTHRHRAMAWLMAGGLRRGEIARRLGYAPTSVSHIAKSPQFQALVAECQRELSDRFIRATVDRMAAARSVRRGRQA